MASAVSNGALTVQGHIIAAIALGTELDPLLADIARAAARLCHSHMAVITLLADNHDELELVGAFGARTPVLGVRIPVTTTFSGLVITSGCSVRSANVECDPRLAARAIPLMSGARGVLAVPLRDAAGAFGTLGVAKRGPWHFTDRSEALLSQLADCASIAIQNAQLREQLRRTAAHESPQPRAVAPALPIGRDPHHVSPREHQILNLLAGGMTCGEAAAALHISGRTVQHYIERLKMRFHKPRLPALVGYVMQHGVVSPLVGETVDKNRPPEPSVT